MRIVMKFGGTSLADAAGIDRAARLIAERVQAGDEVAAVVSAQGKMTDELLNKGKEVSAHPAAEELDVLLAAGEQISAALVALRLSAFGLSVRSMSGGQAGIRTDAHHGAARITEVDPTPVEDAWASGETVVVCGFQGVDPAGRVTTIGRGGSDTSAVALAAALRADVCRIFTDVSGVYSADPRVVGAAVQHKDISYDEMLELATLGAGVLHNRSVLMAKTCGVPLEVCSSFHPGAGTRVVSECAGAAVSGITCDRETAMMTVIGVDGGEATCCLFGALRESGIPVDVIIRSPGTAERRGTVSFSMSESALERARTALEEQRAAIGWSSLLTEPEMAKVSLVGAGMQGGCAVAARMLEALQRAGIEPQYITTGEIRISVIVPRGEAEEAVRQVHEAFFH